MNFTVLQSVYKNDDPCYLDDCLGSISSSTVLPVRIVLVKDGLLTKPLEDVIAKWESRLPLYVCGYDANRGLAYALSYGLQYCDTELVCRMDSDDIVRNDRFEKQITFMAENPNIALCSGYIQEFVNDPSIKSSLRQVPQQHEEIVEYLKKRNSFNHMAVCFRKSIILSVGNYQQVPFFEDYDLWIRIVQGNYMTANIPLVLVDARIGNDMVGRRHGMSYAMNELSFLKRQLRSGFLSHKEFVLLCLSRVPLRVLPKRVLTIIYRLLRK
jgi:glycosyltransferase involved in cell wall biosynthesis